MRLKKFWVVARPTSISVIEDICFETDVPGLVVQVRGGLRPNEIVAAFTQRAEAEMVAHYLLKQMNDCTLALRDMLDDPRFNPAPGGDTGQESRP